MGRGGREEEEFLAYFGDTTNIIQGSESEVIEETGNGGVISDEHKEKRETILLNESHHEVLRGTQKTYQSQSTQSLVFLSEWGPQTVDAHIHCSRGHSFVQGLSFVVH
jgi:hypothetical protein